ncbi:MAG: polymer-forming cytoskeletal protein [Bdellovibrionales bacterium]
MFGRREDEEGETAPTQDQATTQNPTTPRATIAEPPRSVGAGVMTGRHRMEKRRPSPEPLHGGTEERKLIVGRGLSLSGEIAACDVLVVEGKVEAKLSDGKLLEITETGQFTGAVEIENADIAGRYDGDLTVHGRLTIRGTGRISGIVKYGELEVNAGGQVIGEMQVVGGSKSSNKAPSFKNAAKFTSASDEDSTETEDDNGEALFGRKTVNG